jgi:hypothetical protein
VVQRKIISKVNIGKNLGGAKFLLHHSGDYFSKKQDSSVFDKEYESLKKILRTEIFG